MKLLFYSLVSFTFYLLSWLTLITFYRYSTIWGGASLLTMLVSAMKQLLEMSDWVDWDFVLNLSESDFPVKTQAELVEFLSNNRSGLK